MGERRGAKEMLDLQEDLCWAAGDLMRKKQADYGASDDPLANFRHAEKIHMDPRHGVLLRMMDKMSRLGNSVSKPLENESVKDSVIDIINYAVIFYALHEEAQPNG